MQLRECPSRSGTSVRVFAFWSPDDGTLEVHCSRPSGSPRVLSRHLDELFELDDTEIITIGDLEWIQNEAAGLQAVAIRVMDLAGTSLAPGPEPGAPRAVEGALRLEATLDGNRRASFERPVVVRGRTESDGSLTAEIEVGADRSPRWFEVAENLHVAAGESGELARLRVGGIRLMTPELFDG